MRFLTTCICYAFWSVSNRLMNLFIWRRLTKGTLHVDSKKQELIYMYLYNRKRHQQIHLYCYTSVGQNTSPSRRRSSNKSITSEQVLKATHVQKSSIQLKQINYRKLEKCFFLVILWKPTAVC